MKYLKNKRIIIGLVVVLFITLVFFVSNDKRKQNIKKTKEKEQAEILYKRANHLTDKKTFEGLDIKNIVINRLEDKINISMDLINNSVGNIDEFNGYLVLLDIDGKDVGKVKISVPAIPKSDKASITVDITKYYGEARNFRIEKK